jgi:hypothetical protein
MGGVLFVVGAVVLWMCVPMAANLAKMMRLYPDLWVLRRARGADEGKAVQRAREDARRARKRVLVGLGIALLAIGALVLFAATFEPGGSADGGAGSPEPEKPVPVPTRTFAEAESDFRTAWNASDVAQIKDMVAASERGTRIPFLDRSIKKRGWQEELPTLGSPETKDYGRNRWTARYALPEKDLPMEVSWEWEETRWVIVNWSFPNR